MHYCNHLSIMAAACSVAHSNVETETFSLGYVEPLIQREEEEEELTEAIEKPKGKGRKRVRALYLDTYFLDTLESSMLLIPSMTKAQ